MLIRVPPEGTSSAPGAGIVEDRVTGLHFTPGGPADLGGERLGRRARRMMGRTRLEFTPRSRQIHRNRPAKQSRRIPYLWGRQRPVR